MSKILVIGAGGVGAVATHKMAMLPEYFSHITLASRRLSSCERVKASIAERLQVDINIAELDADDCHATARLIEQVEADLVVHLALPYQDLAIMDACLETGTDYLDTANYEPREQAKFEYHWQWAYQERFQEKGIMALLGSGFDPGVTNVFTAYIKKHLIDTPRRLDILDCNGGEHGQHFATNFNPEINIREVTAPARHWENKHWIETPALSHKQVFDFPEVGARDMYLMYHEELESLSKNFPEIERMRFWMTFGESYLTHIKVLQNIGLTSIEPIIYEGKEIIPLQFLKAVLPDPRDLGKTTTGKTCIGNIVSGTHAGKERHIYLYNICDHEACFAETGAQAVSYTTGVPAMIGAALMISGVWHKAGVFNMEEFDPDPFMDMLNQHGLAWHYDELPHGLDF